MKEERFNLVMQSFGRESEYKRAILSILSFYAFSSLPVSQTRIFLFTDQPDYFKLFLSGLPTEIIFLNPEKIRNMRGGIDFLHRIKIAVIEEAFLLSEGNILYADSDTFFTHDPSPLLRKLSPQQCYMHCWEFEFEHLRTYSRETQIGCIFRSFLDLIETKKFILTNGKKVSYTPRHVSWNAGVMMFHHSHSRFIPDVYALTEQFFPQSQHHASEQFAFSLIIQENVKIRPCDSVIYHYWYRIKKEIVDLFLNKRINTTWSRLPLQEKLSDVKCWCSELPLCFDKHILMLKDNAIQAFNENSFRNGFKHFLKAWIRSPFDFVFIKDLLYHSKRAIKSL